MNKKKGIGIACLLITVILFSTYEVVNKMIIGKVGAMQLNFLRFFIGGLLLFGILAIKRDIKIDLKNLFKAGLLGVINVVVSMSFLQIALSSLDSKASVVAVIFSSNPIFVILICAVLGKERLTLKKAIGMIVGFAGVVAVLAEQFDIQSLLKFSSIYALLSAACYAVYTVYGREVIKEIGSLKMNAYSFLIGSIVLIPILLLSKENVFAFDSSILPHVIYLSVFVSGLAYVTYFKGLEKVGVGMGALVFFLKPVLASVFAFILLKESIDINVIIGTALIVLGIGIVSIKNKS